MLEKILNKIPYVKELKHENDILREKNRTKQGEIINYSYICAIKIPRRYISDASIRGIIRFK